VPAGAGDFSLHHDVRTGSVAHPPSYPIGTLSLGLNRPGREADHSTSSSAEVNKSWIYSSNPPIILHGVVLS
jgi:hypothetical protein